MIVYPMDNYITRLRDRYGLPVEEDNNFDELALQFDTSLKSNENPWFSDQSTVGFFRTIATPNDLQNPSSFIEKIKYFCEHSAELPFNNHQHLSFTIPELNEILVSNCIADVGKEWWSELQITFNGIEGDGRLPTINYTYLPESRLLIINSIQMPWQTKVPDEVIFQRFDEFAQNLDEAKPDISYLRTDDQVLANNCLEIMAAIVGSIRTVEDDVLFAELSNRIKALDSSIQQKSVKKMFANSSQKWLTIVSRIKELAAYLESFLDFYCARNKNNRLLKSLNRPLRWRDSSTKRLNTAPNPHTLSLVILLKLLQNNSSTDNVTVVMPLGFCTENERIIGQKTLVAQRLLHETDLGEVNDTAYICEIPSEHVLPITFFTNQLNGLKIV